MAPRIQQPRTPCLDLRPLVDFRRDRLPSRFGFWLHRVPLLHSRQRRRRTSAAEQPASTIIRPWRSALPAFSVGPSIAPLAPP